MRYKIGRDFVTHIEVFALVEICPKGTRLGKTDAAAAIAATGALLLLLFRVRGPVVILLLLQWQTSETLPGALSSHGS